MKKRILILSLLAALLLLPACGKKAETAAPKADLSALYTQLTALPDAPEMVPVSEKRMANYYGIDPTACPQAILSICGDGLRADEIWLVEASDEEAAKKLVTLAENRVKQLSEETENYRPEQNIVVKAAKIVQSGSSVGLFISPQADKMADMFSAAFQ